MLDDAIDHQSFQRTDELALVHLQHRCENAGVKGAAEHGGETRQRTQGPSASRRAVSIVCNGLTSRNELSISVHASGSWQKRTSSSANSGLPSALAAIRCTSSGDRVAATSLPAGSTRPRRPAAGPASARGRRRRRAIGTWSGWPTPAAPAGTAARRQQPAHQLERAGIGEVGVIEDDGQWRCCVAAVAAGRGREVLSAAPAVSRQARPDRLPVDAKRRPRVALVRGGAKLMLFPPWAFAIWRTRASTADLPMPPDRATRSSSSPAHAVPSFPPEPRFRRPGRPARR